MAMVYCIGVALFAVIHALLSVGATVVAGKAKVSMAAQGAIYLGIGAVALKFLPLAGYIIEMIFPAPVPVASEPLMILGQLDHLDASQWSVVGCTALSFFGWFFGRSGWWFPSSTWVRKGHIFMLGLRKGHLRHWMCNWTTHKRALRGESRHTYATAHVTACL